MKRQKAKAVIYVFEDQGYMYLDSNIKENYYIDLLEEFAFDSELDISFPQEKGIYEVIVDLNPTDDGMIATVLESKLIHNLKL